MDMLPRKKSRTSSLAPLSATPSLSLSTLRISVWAEPASSLTRSSKVNISALMRSADSRLSSSSAVSEAGLGLAVEIVEDFGHHLVGVAAAGLRQVGHEFGAQRLLDALDHLLLHRFHLQHAVDHVERELLGQDAEHARGVLRLQLRQHHRDGLRIFVLEVVGEHLFLHVGELFPHVAAGGAADLVHDAVDALRRQVLLQQPLGGVEVAHQRAGSRHARDEFEQHVLDRVDLDGAERRHFQRELAHLVVVEQRPDLAAILLARAPASGSRRAWARSPLRSCRPRGCLAG